MFIQPSTEIRILHDVPIEDTYEHTLWFNTLAAQTTYFSSKTKYSINDSVYQRVDNKSIKVAISAESLYDCNYIMFKNTGFGNKWFYAFLTNIQYVNNDTSIITYEIDVMQTWHFDYQMKQCYVLREHPVTDVIGEHTVPENVETGDYITLRTFIEAPTQIGVAMLITGIPEEVEDYVHAHDPVIKILYGGVYNGCAINCYVIVFSTSLTIQNILFHVSHLAPLFNQSSTGDTIISIFTYNTRYTTDLTGESISTMKHTNFSEDIDATDRLSHRDDNRTIQNNKLFTFPYCSLLLHAIGQTKEFKYERFTGAHTFTFEIEGSFEPNPKYICIPTYYAGYRYDYQSAVTLENYPQLAWTNDGYQIWLAQNQATHNEYIDGQQRMILANLTTGALSLGVGLATGDFGLAAGLLGAAGSGKGVLANYNNIQEAVAKKTDAKATPDRLGGEISSGNALTYSGGNVFHVYCRSIRPEYVSIIDDYFSKFGYQTNRNKIPNRNSRPHWNYVKTSACVITGSVPNVYTQQICSIYNNGITFWKNPSEVGNYNLDNRA